MYVWALDESALYHDVFGIDQQTVTRTIRLSASSHRGDYLSSHNNSKSFST